MISKEGKLLRLECLGEDIRQLVLSCNLLDSYISDLLMLSNEVLSVVDVLRALVLSRILREVNAGLVVLLDDEWLFDLQPALVQKHPEVQRLLNRLAQRIVFGLHC